jgi:hypothetical protein
VRLSYKLDKIKKNIKNRGMNKYKEFLTTIPQNLAEDQAVKELVELMQELLEVHKKLSLEVQQLKSKRKHDNRKAKRQY